jgi:dihydrofolate reductase
MRKITVLSFITLDGVMQAPGGPEEDTENGFKYGGWTAPYGDESSGKTMQKILEPADLLLGRKTFDIFENYWPKHAEHWPGVNEVTKYVLSTTRSESGWQNCVFVSNVEDIKKLKESEGSDIKIWGSSELIQLLLKHDLVDQFWLMIHPIVLGKGKRLFNDESMPAAFTLADSTITTSGVVMANYTKAGDVKTGTVGE